MTEYVSPTDAGCCFDCYASGQGGNPDMWLLGNGTSAELCPYCRRPPTQSTHLPWNDHKHRRCSNSDDNLVPADGRWYRFECAAEHWWISAPVFVEIESWN